MNLTGFIKNIGVPREWNTKENEKRFSYPVTISIPYIGKDGKEHSDELIGELSAGNPDYVQKLEEAKEASQRMEFQVGFSVRTWENKEFNNIRIYNIQILL